MIFAIVLCTKPSNDINSYLFGLVHAVVVVEGQLVHPYGLVVRDPLGQQPASVLGSNTCCHLHENAFEILL